MNAVVKGSIGLAVAVGVVSILFFVLGLHQNPLMSLVSIALFIVFNVVAIYWVLNQTAAENTYGAQLLNGLLVGVIAGLAIFVLSWLNLAVIFPDALEETRVGTIEFLETSGLPQDQLDARIAKLDEMTPLSQSVPGLIGTLATSVIVAAIVAIFRRKK
jgi:hypothetical protein